jgi:hypothetical protein
MSESLQPFEAQREALIEKLKFRDQFESEIKVLNETGVLQLLPDSGEIGIVSIDEEECPLPTFEDLLKRITPELLDILEERASLGFTRFVLVPFAMPLNEQIARYERMRNIFEKAVLADVEWRYQRRDPDVKGEIDQAFIYNPTEEGLGQFGRRGNEISGLSKRDMIKQQGPWHFILTMDVDVPANEFRPYFEEGSSAKEVVWSTEKDARYRGESGMNLEEYFAWANTILTEKKLPLNNEFGLIMAGACTKGAKFPKIDEAVGRSTIDLTDWNMHHVYSGAETVVRISGSMEEK